MATPLNIFIDIANDALIGGLNSSRVGSATNLPLFYGDTLAVQVYLMTPIAQNPNPAAPAGFPYVGVSTAGLSLSLLIDDGLPDTTNIYTQQLTWATDANNSYFYANVPLNTAAIKTLLGSKSSASATLQIGFTQGGLPRTILVQPITITAGIPNVVVAVPAGQTSISAEVALATFIPKDSTVRLGEPIYLSSPLGKIIALMCVDNGDGTASFQANPIN